MRFKKYEEKYSASSLRFLLGRQSRFQSLLDNEIRYILKIENKK